MVWDTAGAISFWAIIFGTAFFVVWVRVQLRRIEESERVLEQFNKGDRVIVDDRAGTVTKAGVTRAYVRLDSGETVLYPVVEIRRAK